jgi:hypothetical protein
LGGGRDATAGGAGGARPVSGGEVLRLKNKGKRAGKDCSPHGKNLGEGTGGGGVVAEKIELGRPSLSGSGVARSSRGEGGSRARESLGGRRTRRAKARRSRGTFTGGAELPRPAMVRWQAPPGGGAHGVRRGCGRRV